MVHSDDDNVVLSCEWPSVITDEATGATRVSATMQPDHHRPFACGSRARRPHVENEAVLTHCFAAIHGFELWRHKSAKRRHELWRAWAELECVTHFCPGLWLLRRHEAARRRSGRAVRNPFERVHATLQC